MPQEQHAEMHQRSEAAAARAEAAEGAARDERLRAALAASKWQEQLHQCAAHCASNATSQQPATAAPAALYAPA
jgi:hypothetical protein